MAAAQGYGYSPQFTNYGSYTAGYDPYKSNEIEISKFRARQEIRYKLIPPWDKEKIVTMINNINDTETAELAMGILDTYRDNIHDLRAFCGHGHRKSNWSSNPSNNLCYVCHPNCHPDYSNPQPWASNSFASSQLVPPSRLPHFDEPEKRDTTRKRIGIICSTIMVSTITLSLIEPNLALIISGIPSIIMFSLLTIGTVWGFNK